MANGRAVTNPQPSALRARRLNLPPDAARMSFVLSPQMYATIASDNLR
jgi:hypothetical protein